MKLLNRKAAAMLPLIVAGSLAGANWPEFRGPTGQGHAKTGALPIRWDTQINVDWKQAVPGTGWSSPIVVEGRVYLTSAIGDDDRALHVLCLGAATGKLLWNTKVFEQGSNAPRIHRKNSHASPTPILENDRLYAHFGHQGTACLDLKGNVLWRNRELSYPPVHGGGGSPALVDDLLVFSCDGAQEPFVAALEKATGKLRWRTNRSEDAKKKFSFSTPLVIEVNGRKQVLSPGSDMLGAYDPKTGEELWKVRYDGYSVVPRPVYGHGLVFIGTGFDRATVMAIRPDGQGDVTETHVAWTLRKSAPHTPSLLLVGKELYLVSDGGIASCVDAVTGMTHWQERLGGDYSASPLYADGRIYFQNEAGLGVVLEPGTTFKKIAENDLDEKTLASYATDGASLFIRTESALYRVAKQ